LKHLGQDRELLIILKGRWAPHGNPGSVGTIAAHAIEVAMACLHAQGLKRDVRVVEGAF
jgi:hypothetical protein